MKSDASEQRKSSKVSQTPYSTPINNPSKVTDAARACLVSLRLISDSHPTEHTIAAYQVIDGGDDVEECHYKNNLPDICVD